MKTEEQYALVLSLTDALYTKGSWCGETHIQKTAYFLETLEPVPSNLSFTLYKHGPYSFELHDILGDMLNLGFIAQEHQPPYGPRLRLTDIGRGFLARQQKNIATHETSIKNMANTFCRHSVQGLEKVATALLLRKQDDTLEPDAIAQKLHNIKPHISLPEAHAAVREMLQLCPCEA